MRTETTSVLVVGGGLAGLSSAVFLSWYGVPAIVVDRHPGSSPHPRAIGYSPRTVELFRAVGVGAAIPPTPSGVTVRRVRVHSLAGEWFEEQPWGPSGEPGPEVEYSPCGGAGLAQDKLEPILRDRAVELGADVRLSTELVSFEQDAAGVTALLRDADGEYTVRADYLIGADGHRSPVRAALGIGRSGHGQLAVTRSVLFRAPLAHYLERGFAQFVIDQPDRPELAGMLTTYGDGRWVFFANDADAITEDTVPDTLRAVTGLPDLDFEVVTTGRWEVTMQVADHYADGRVFLAGDAAHTLPPNRGAYNTNMGIEDAHNLAWKLAAVLSGRSAPRLLDSYEPERRPIAVLCHDQLLIRQDWNAGAGGRDSADLFDDAAMGFGKLYRSAVLPDASTDLPAAMRPEQWAGQPGTRAPHLWLDGGTELSTLDLMQPDWVLFTEDDRWIAAAAQLGVRCELLGDRVDTAAFRAGYGIGHGGASLIRPDGHIAWRVVELPADPVAALTAALDAAACQVAVGV